MDGEQSQKAIEQAVEDYYAALIPEERDELAAWGEFAKLDWVIVGGESGPAARPMHPDWARSLRDQTLAAGVPFFFKQWGEFAPVYADPPDEPGIHYICRPDGVPVMTRRGKAKAGRLLDGIEHNEFPTREQSNGL